MRISGHKTRAIFDRYNIVDPTDLKEAAAKIERGAEKRTRAGVENHYREGGAEQSGANYIPATGFTFGNAQNIPRNVFDLARCDVCARSFAPAGLRTSSDYFLDIASSSARRVITVTKCWRYSAEA